MYTTNMAAAVLFLSIFVIANLLALYASRRMDWRQSDKRPPHGPKGTCRPDAVYRR